MKNKEQQGRHPKERDEWQLDIEQRELDRSLQEQVRVGHGRYRNRKLGAEGQEGEPEIAAHARGGVERLADFIRVVGVGSQLCGNIGSGPRLSIDGLLILFYPTSPAFLGLRHATLLPPRE